MTGTTKRQWLEGQQEFIEHGADKDVIAFIADFLYGAGAPDAIRATFASGYCYYFARILQSAFRRGQVCHKYPASHAVWLDEGRIAYDIDGVCAEYQELIPMTDYGAAVFPFLHVPGLELPADGGRAQVERIRSRTVLDGYDIRTGRVRSNEEKAEDDAIINHAMRQHETTPYAVRLELEARAQCPRKSRVPELAAVTSGAMKAWLREHE